MAKPSPDDFLTKREVADHLRVSIRTLDRYIECGLPTFKLDPGQQGRVVIRRSDLVRWLKARAG